KISCCRMSTNMSSDVPTTPSAPALRMRQATTWLSLRRVKGVDVYVNFCPKRSESRLSRSSTKVLGMYGPTQPAPTFLTLSKLYVGCDPAIHNCDSWPGTLP